jgi:hypothetical protein
MDESEGPVVLMVVPEDDQREQYEAWISEIGVEVRACPGPGAADDCVGVREGTCPLAKGADVVILDSRVAHERELEAFYLLHGEASRPARAQASGTPTFREPIHAAPPGGYLAVLTDKGGPLPAHRTVSSGPSDRASSVLKQ